MLEILTVSEENMGRLVFGWMRVFEVWDEGVDRLRKKKDVRLLIALHVYACEQLCRLIIIIITRSQLTQVKKEIFAQL